MAACQCPELVVVLRPDGSYRSALMQARIPRSPVVSIALL
jgi:hypothetical protein